MTPTARDPPEMRLARCGAEILAAPFNEGYCPWTMLDPDGFVFDLGDDARPGEDLAEVFSVPGLPTLPALKPRFAPGESQRVVRPLWHSQPEPGIVQALQTACESYTPPPVSVAVPVTRRSRKRRARA